ncbi:MAG: SpoIIE family protein phosphatase [Lachnospiraceae bacterium]|nr:SpoIIE family protein phosphatase [Lachnospiraceae bacterium]
MPEKTIREMEEWEKKHYSLAAKVFHATLMASLILGGILLLTGLVMYTVSISQLFIQEGYNQALNARSVLERANEQICQNNAQEMFVTVWLGVLELDTGRLVAANAGHEYPVVMNPDGNLS